MKKTSIFLIGLFFSVQLFGQSFTEYARQGAKLMDNGKYEDAIKPFDKAIELNSDYNSAYGNRGICKAKLGRHDEAIQDFDKSIELKNQITNAPESFIYWKGNTYFSRGLSKQAIGRIEQAIADFEEAKKLKYELSDCDTKIAECKELLKKK